MVAVRDVGFGVASHLVTLSASGCGKTTTLEIAGTRAADRRAHPHRRGATSLLPATDRDIAMVFQSYALFPHMTVLENVGYGLSVSGRPKAEVKERAETTLELVGLEGFGARLPSELSGGQQQRVAVARAVVLEPEVLLFDEPLSNLDAKLRRRVREEIRELQQRLGLTAVYVTHDQEEALAISDRIIVMNNAVIAQEGVPRDLYEAPPTGSSPTSSAVPTSPSPSAPSTASRGDDGTTPPPAASRPAPGLPISPFAPKVSSLTADPTASIMAGRVRRASYLGSHVSTTSKPPSASSSSPTRTLTGSTPWAARWGSGSARTVLRWCATDAERRNVCAYQLQKL